MEATKTVNLRWGEHVELKPVPASSHIDGTLKKKWDNEVSTHGRAKFFVLDSDGLRFYNSKAEAVDQTETSRGRHGYLDLANVRMQVRTYSMFGYSALLASTKSATLLHLLVSLLGIMLSGPIRCGSEAGASGI